MFKQLPRTGLGWAITVVATSGLILALTRRIIALWISGMNDHGQTLGLAYNHYILAPNYFANGFIRRGLGGTIAALLDDSPSLTADVPFYLFSVAWVAIPLAVALYAAAKRDLRSGAFLGVLLCLSPQLRFWAQDVGRIDMFAAGFAMWAGLAAFQARWRTAAVLIAAGSLAHEAAVFFGGSLAVAVALHRHRHRQLNLHAAAAGLILLGTLLVAVAIGQRLAGSSASTIAATIARKDPAGDVRDLATFISLSGWRGLQSSLCVMYRSPGFPLYLGSTLAVLPFVGAMFGYRTGRQWGLWLVAGLLPMVAISLITIDYGRWLALATLNLWALAALLAAEASREDAPQLGIVLSGSLLLLLNLLGTTALYSPSRKVEHLAQRIWTTPYMDQVKGTDLCDPGWRALVQGWKDQARAAGRRYPAT